MKLTNPPTSARPRRLNSSLLTVLNRRFLILFYLR